MKTIKDVNIILAIILIVLELEIANSRYAKQKKILRIQKVKDKPNVFVLFNAMSDEEISRAMHNTQFKDIMNRVDGIKNPNNDPIISANIPNTREVLRSVISPRSADSSNSTSSSDSSSEGDEIDSFVNENIKSKYYNPQTNIFKQQIEQNQKSLAEALTSPFKNNNNKKGDQYHDLTKKTVLRFGSSCNKGASKACSKACKSVLKGVCHEYKCSSGMKSRFKSECSRNCRTRFKTD